MNLADNIILFYFRATSCVVFKGYTYRPVIWNFIEHWLFVMVRYSNMTGNINLQ